MNNLQIMNNKHLIDNIQIIYTISEDQDDLFTLSHIKYDVTVFYKDKALKVKYQQNKKLKKIKVSDIMLALMNDYYAYEDTLNLNDFMGQYGYEDYNEAKKIYNECKREYKRMNKMFSKEEIDKLYDYFVEKGEF